MKFSKMIILVSITLLLGGVSLYSFYSGNREDSEEKAHVIRGRRVVRDGKIKRVQRGKKSARVSIKSSVKEKEKPTFNLEAEEEAALTKAQQQLLKEIREALDDNDEKRVLKFVRKLQKDKEWPDGIPKAIKMAAIEALGWFGSSCLPEIAGFLADADEEILQSAVEKYEEALSDFDLSDRERSLILVEASKVVTDPDAMDSMLFELNNMRHSVAIETIKQLLVVGGEATQAVLPDNIEFYTGEEGMTTPDKLDEWLTKNPDDEGDEEFYGGSN